MDSTLPFREPILMRITSKLRNSRNPLSTARSIEEVDFSSPGSLKIRAKGKLIIHGIEMDRIIRCTLKIGPASLEIESDFIVRLEEHDIDIPSIVKQKIAEVIDVSIQLKMQKMK